MPRQKRQTLSTNRFGLEIEFTENELNLWDWAEIFDRNYRVCSSSPRIHATDNYQHSDGTRWELKPDGSCGLELVTPAMRWDRWPEVREVLKILEENSALPDYRCGLHVHHEIQNYTLTQLRRLTRVWGAIEDVAFSLVNEDRQSNPYCIPFKDTYENWQAYSRNTELSAIRQTIRLKGRRRSMNLMNYATRGTVEFRLHHGTINENEIFNWTVFTQAVVDLSRRGIHLNTLTKLSELPLEVKFDRLVALINQYQEAEDVCKALNFFRDKLAKQPSHTIAANVLNEYPTHMVLDWSAFCAAFSSPLRAT